MFTGNEDTNVKIIEKLSLSDRQSICQQDKYFNHLCNTNITLKNKLLMTNNKVDKIINFF